MQLKNPPVTGRKALGLALRGHFIKTHPFPVCSIPAATVPSVVSSYCTGRRSIFANPVRIKQRGQPVLPPSA